MCVKCGKLKPFQSYDLGPRNLKSLALVIAEIFLEDWKFKIGHVMLPRPFRDGLSTSPPNLKFLYSPTTKVWKAMQNVEIGVILGGYGWPKVIGNITIW